ncbi:AraC family transcriptional regulator [Mesorhizobium sp. KR1-2]|uniref:AraC family transcriptional regulator n=1 Tax=Mesorhizobium sp. KR1-2 TaxID=3156609 RepID=UPI0032B336B4
MQGGFKVFRCHSAGVQAVAASSRHVFPRHWHEQFGVGVIRRGAQRSLSGRGTVEATAGDIITVNPGEVHDGAPIGDAGRSWHMLYFDPAMVLAVAAEMDLPREAEFHRPAMTDPMAASLFDRLYLAMTAPRHCEMEREEMLLGLMARLVGKRADPSRAYVPAAIRLARELIDDAPAATLTLADLAQASGLGRFQLLRGFAKATGFTPHAYIVQRRIDLARWLIAGGASLADAAVESGFADQAHMTRTFTRRYGVSPGAYAAAAT